MLLTTTALLLISLSLVETATVKRICVCGTPPKICPCPRSGSNYESRMWKVHSVRSIPSEPTLEPSVAADRPLHSGSSGRDSTIDRPMGYILRTSGAEAFYLDGKTGKLVSTSHSRHQPVTASESSQPPLPSSPQPLQQLPPLVRHEEITHEHFRPPHMPSQPVHLPQHQQQMQQLLNFAAHQQPYSQSGAQVHPVFSQSVTGPQLIPHSAPQQGFFSPPLQQQGFVSPQSPQQQNFVHPQAFFAPAQPFQQPSPQFFPDPAISGIQQLIRRVKQAMPTRLEQQRKGDAEDISSVGAHSHPAPTSTVTHIASPTVSRHRDDIGNHFEMFPSGAPPSATIAEQPVQPQRLRSFLETLPPALIAKVASKIAVKLPPPKFSFSIQPSKSIQRRAPPSVVENRRQ